MLLDQSMKLNTFYFYEQINFDNYVYFWSYSNYGHYFSKENPNYFYKMRNITSYQDSEGNIYIGQFVIQEDRKIMHGKGFLKYKNYSYYIGNFYDGQITGYGIYINFNEKTNKIYIYDGKWLNGYFMSGTLCCSDIKKNSNNIEIRE